MARHLRLAAGRLEGAGNSQVAVVVVKAGHRRRAQVLRSQEQQGRHNPLSSPQVREVKAVAGASDSEAALTQCRESIRLL